MSATFIQREAAAEVLRAGGSQVAAAGAARVALSTLKRWLRDPSFQALIASSPLIRPGLPPGLADQGGVPVSEQDLRCRMWLASNGAVLGSYLPPAAFESAGGVLHVHRVEPGAVERVVGSIEAGAFPADSRYIPVPLEGLNELLENLPLVVRLASPDTRESLAAWLEPRWPHALGAPCFPVSLFDPLEPCSFASERLFAVPSATTLVLVVLPWAGRAGGKRGRGDWFKTLERVLV